MDAARGLLSFLRAMILISIGMVGGLYLGQRIGSNAPSDTALVQNPALRELQEQFRSLSKAVAPSVVAVRGRSEVSRSGGTAVYESTGSGFVFDQDGYILTNEHVIHGATELRIALSDGRELPAELLGSDVRADLAVLKVDTDLPALALADLEQTAQGDLVAALGNPFGLANRDGQPAFSVGEISKRGVTLAGLGSEDDRHYSNMIQISAPIHPGSSGGPLLNLDGKVIGVNTAVQRSLHLAGAEQPTAASEPVGFAIPFTDRIREIIALLREGQSVRYGWLGVTLDSRVPQEGGLRRVVVAAVHPGGPADRAGLKEGDIVTHFAGLPIEDVDQFIREIGRFSVGQPAELRVLRNGQEAVVHPVLSDRMTEMAVLGSGENRSGSYYWRGLKIADFSRGGVLVLEVTKDSPGALADISVGAVIQMVGGVQVRDLRQFRRIAGNISGSVKVLLNDGKVREVSDPR